MAKKQVCDYCGEEIDFELSSEVNIYDNAREDYDLEKDICEKCKKKILKFLKNKEEIRNG